MLPAALLLLRVLAPLALSGSVNAEAEAAYDSNANRAPEDNSLGIAPRGGPLLRGLVSGQLGYAGDLQRLRLSMQVGGKLFLTPDLRDQDIGVVVAGYEHGVQLHHLRLTGVVDYFEAFQATATAPESHDFRSLSGGGRLVGSRAVSDHSLHRIDGSLDIGGQLFMYKPDENYSFVAPSIAGRFGGSLHAGDPELGHDFDLGVHLRFDYREYMFGSIERTDYFVQTGGSVTWQGPLLVQLGYTAQLDFSTVDSESFQRHLLLVKLAFRLPGDLYVTLKTQIDLFQGNFIPVNNIDDDNRSLALFDLERPLGRGFALAARYTGYFSLPSDGNLPYQRHTAYLGLSYNWKPTRPPPASAAP